MTTPIKKIYTSNDLLIKMLKAKPKLTKTIEQIDTDSLNTMDYYQEDSKNSLIAESKLNNALSYKTKKPKNIITYTEVSDFTKTINNDIYINSNTNPSKDNLNIVDNQKIQKRFKHSTKTCCKNFANFDNKNKTCNKCKKCYCEKCFKENFSKNYCETEGNNYEKNFKEKRMSNLNSFIKNLEPLEPLDTNFESELKIKNKVITSKSKNNKNLSEEKKIKIEEQNKEYEYLLNQIEKIRKEIEIKKDINFNILNLLKKAIEYEYGRYTNKLNELEKKLNKIKTNINEKMNVIYNNEIELQIDIDINKNNLKNFSKILENFNKKIMTKPFFRGFKLYESNDILLNYSDTYYMKNKEVFSELPLGKVFIRVNRYSNNYQNYLNFSTQIKQKEKIQEDSTNCSFKSDINCFNKSRFVVNMIVNNKFLKLNKTNKDSNDTSLSYELSEKEDNILLDRNKNNNNGVSKKNNFNIKLILCEIIL